MKRLTPAILASPGLPPAQVDQAQAQAELRAKRRDRRLHAYPATFDIELEIEAQIATLGVRIMLRPNPLHYIDEVDALADAVYFACTRLAATIARAHAAGHAAKLPLDVRGRELKRIEAQAARRVPRPAAITAADLQTGSWVSTLTTLAAPLCGGLQEMLGARPPSSQTVSKQLEDLLRGIDDAARALHNRLKAAETSAPVARPRHVEPVTQAQCREARRTRMPYSWPADFALSREIIEIFEPLAGAVAALPNPGRAAAEVEKVADAVYELVTDLADLVGAADSARRVAHLPIDSRVSAKRPLDDLAPPPPARPTITEAQLVEGTWPAPLVELAAPYAEPLAALLRADARIGGESVSDHLEEGLRFVDAAALQLQRRIDRLESVTLRHRTPAAPAPASPADRARAELTRLGVPLP